MFINSGRVLCDIVPQVLEIGFDGMICGGGTHIICDGKTVLNYTVPHEDARRIAQKMDDLNLNGVYERYDKVFFNKNRVSKISPELLYERVFKRYGEDSVIDIDDPDFSFNKYHCFYGPDGDAQALAQYLKDELLFIPRGEYGFEMTPIKYNKATAMKIVTDYYGSGPEDCYAFGDSYNDLPMLSFTPNSAGIGDCDEIRDKVAFVSTAVSDNGVENAMKHFGLI